MIHQLIIHIVMDGKVFRENVVMGHVSKEECEKIRNNDINVINYRGGLGGHGQDSINVFHNFQPETPEERKWASCNFI
jgi:hypothetical protein